MPGEGVSQNRGRDRGNERIRKMDLMSKEAGYLPRDGMCICPREGTTGL